MAARLWEFESPPPHHEIKSPLPVWEEGFLVCRGFSSIKKGEKFFSPLLEGLFFWYTSLDGSTSRVGGFEHGLGKLVEGGRVSSFETGRPEQK